MFSKLDQLEMIIYGSSKKYIFYKHDLEMIFLGSYSSKSDGSPWIIFLNGNNYIALKFK